MGISLEKIGIMKCAEGERANVLCVKRGKEKVNSVVR